MQQRITAFHQDSEQHWVAELACGHTQHVRHDPPWQVRPWVLEEATRLAHVGTTLNCVLCDAVPTAYDDARVRGLCHDGAAEVSRRRSGGGFVGDIKTTASAYTNEPVRYAPLEVVDIDQAAAAVVEAYRNQVLLQVNQHCLRMGVLTGQYPWHAHPKSDELFLVLEGRLVIELAGGKILQLGPHQSVTIPAGIVHRTRGEGRTVNLCVEAVGAETVFVPGPDAAVT